MRAPTIEQGAFDGPAKGLQAMGQAIGETGRRAVAVIEDYHDARAAAQDYDLNNQASKMYEDALGNARTSLQGRPESAVGPALQKMSDEMQKKLEGFEYSPSGRKWAQQYHEQMMRNARLSLTQEARTGFAETAKATAVERYGTFMDAGDYEGAERVLTGAVQVGLLPAPAAESMRLGGMIRQEHQAAGEFIENDPWTAQARFSEWEQTGQSGVYSLMTKAEFGKYHIAAQREIAARQRQTGDVIDQQMAGGQLRSEDAIRAEAMKAHLPEEQVTALFAGLRDVPTSSPEERASHLKTQSDLMTALDNYDPAADVNGTQHAEIKQLIRERLPTSERATWLEMLRKQEALGPNMQSLRRSSMSRQVDLVLSRKAAREDSAEKQAAIWQRARTIKNEMAKFVQANPDMSDRDARAWIDGQLSSEIVLRAAQAKDGR